MCRGRSGGWGCHGQKWENSEPLFCPVCFVINPYLALGKSVTKFLSVMTLSHCNAKEEFTNLELN
jgi:hypothetical protein